MPVSHDTATSLLDPREEHFHIPSCYSGLLQFLRRLTPQDMPTRSVVLYVHGATFASALSDAHHFDGRSWRDEMCAAGIDVWSLDLHGYGQSIRIRQCCEPPDGREPLCAAEDAAGTR